MQKITPFLWFDAQAEEAIAFYTGLFQNSRLGDVQRYGEAGPGEPGSVMTASFHLAGQKFMALNGGPHFNFTPAISFFVSCDTESEIDQLFQALSEGGVLMPLQEYPFAKKYAWVQDKFGVTWQLMLAGRSQKIAPALLFVGQQHGKAEEAINLYTSLFENSDILSLERYNPGEELPDGSVKHAAFRLHGREFMAMDGGVGHDFTFNEAFSLYVNCETQAEVDRLWEQLSQGGETQMCGWLKDRFGVSWQIIPAELGDLLSDPDPAKAESVMRAMLQMVKIDVEGLKRAREAAY